MLITVKQLKSICTKLPDARAESISAAINTVCPQYGMDLNIFHEFMANVIHETKELSTYEEDMWYTAKQIRKTWPTRFPTLQDAIPFEKNPEKLANKVYGGRLGNKFLGDGYKFRGSGPIQMTGRDHFTNFSIFMQRKHEIKKSPEDWAFYIRTDHNFAMHSACWVFSVAKGLNDEAANDLMKTIIRRINGAFNGNDARLSYYEKLKSLIPL